MPLSEQSQEILAELDRLLRVSQREVRKIVSGKPKVLRVLYPSFNPSTGEFEYPVRKDIIEYLSGVGLLIKVSGEKVVTCPRCGYQLSMTKYFCPYCLSTNIRTRIIVEHSECGYKGDISSFKAVSMPRKYVCPQCGEYVEWDQLKLIGGHHVCENCGSSFSLPRVQHICAKCRYAFDSSSADRVDFSYFEFSPNLIRWILLIRKITEILSTSPFSAFIDLLYRYDPYGIVCMRVKVNNTELLIDTQYTTKHLEDFTTLVVSYMPEDNIKENVVGILLRNPRFEQRYSEDAVRRFLETGNKILEVDERWDKDRIKEEIVKLLFTIKKERMEIKHRELR